MHHRAPMLMSAVVIVSFLILTATYSMQRSAWVKPRW